MEPTDKAGTRFSETVEVHGHVIDSGLIGQVLDEVMERGADYEITHFRIGKRHEDVSSMTLRVEIEGHDEMVHLLERLQSYGANPTTVEDVELVAVEIDGVLPEGFYSTTNLPTRIRVDRTWIDVDRPEMDCAVVLDRSSGTARTVPMDDVKTGMEVVCGFGGVRVTPRSKPRVDDPNQVTFEFMTSDVSSEKPQALLVDRVAAGMREAKADGRKILWVAGPALVHTGSVEPTCALIRAGYMDILFAGNALAAHDIENNMFGTSLGVSLSHGIPTEHGHEHHVRAINRVRRAGSIAAAVAEGAITGGIMWHAVQHGVDMVLAASVRDDGPLPDVIRDAIQAQGEMRKRIPEVGFTLMVATLLHSIATGNMLPASVPLVCVDINPASVTKLVDRGSSQSAGIVTDVGLFLRELASQLAPDELAQIRADAATSEAPRG